MWPLNAMAISGAPALGGGLPSQNNGALSAAPSFGQATTPGATAPTMMLGGASDQGGGSWGAPSSPPSDNSSQWQSLIAMLMQRLGMGGAAGGQFGGANPSSGFLQPFGVSGMYGR